MLCIVSLISAPLNGRLVENAFGIKSIVLHFVHKVKLIKKMFRLKGAAIDSLKSKNRIVSSVKRGVTQEEPV